MVIVLGLFAALAYGLSDFVGGLVTRRVPLWQVAFWAQIAATVVCLASIPAFPTGVTPGALAWGVPAGVGAGMGFVAIYAGLGHGRMSVVAPLSGVGSAVIPVLVGVAGGERPGVVAWVGLGLALPAIWLVAAGGNHALTPDRARRGRHADTVLGLLAGLGFGVEFAALGQVPAESGMAPLALAQAISAVVIALGARAAGSRLTRRSRGLPGAVLAGVLVAAATLAFQLAVHAGELAVAGVLVALYPMVTVLLAWLVLRERIAPTQGAGLAAAVAAIVLITVG